MTIVEYINQYQGYISIALMVMVLILLIICILNSSKINKNYKKNERLMRGVKVANVESLVMEYLDKVDEIYDRLNEIDENNKEVKKEISSCIQKISIIRFKAFENVGSDQSFSIALLDKEDNGIILTGIYGRSDSTTYAKPVKNGKATYELSEEEKTVLNNAINNI